jgi:hypothetical protein
VTACLLARAPAAAGAGPYADVPPGSYGARAIADLTARGVLQGVGGGMFMPEQPMTRAQTAALLARAEGWPLDGIGPAFADVSPGEWFYGAVLAAAGQGVMGGVGGGRFAPDAAETEAQAVVSAVRALGLRHVADDEAAAGLPAWAAGSYAVASHLGLLDASPAPDAPLTRAAAAVLVDRMLSVGPADLRREGDRVAAYVHLLPGGGAVHAGAMVRMRAYAHDRAGYIVPADFLWSATGGSVAPDGTLTVGPSGSVRVTARVPGGPSATAVLTIHAPAALRFGPTSTVVSAGSAVTVPVEVVDAAGRLDPADTGRTITLQAGGRAWSAPDADGRASVPVQLPPGTSTLTATAPGLAPATLAVTATPSTYSLLVSAPSATLAVGQGEPLAVSVVDGAGNPVAGTFALRISAEGGSVAGAPATVSGPRAAAGTLSADRPGEVTVTAAADGGAVARGKLTLQAVPAGDLAVSAPGSVTAGGQAQLTFSGPVPDGTHLTVTVTDPGGHHPPGYGAAFTGGRATVRVAPTIAGTWRFTAVAAGYAGTATLRVTPGPPAQVVVHPLPTSILLPGQAADLYVAEGDAYGNPVDAPLRARLTLAGAGTLTAGTPPGGGGGAADGAPLGGGPTGSDPVVDLPGPGVAATYTAPAAPGQATLTVAVAGLPAATVALRTVAAAGDVVAGRGMWLTFPDWRASSDAAILAAARAAGVTHIYLEVATSSDGFYGARALDDLLWQAHDAGIALIAWVYPALWQPAQDVAVAQAVAGYVTPLGERADGLAADVEENMDPATVAAYAAAARAALTQGPLVGVTYPPQQMPDYPFAALAPYVDAWAPMDYWHQTERDYTYHEVYTWVAASLAGIEADAGRADIPFDVIVQTFDAFADSGRGIFSPAPAEVAAAVAAAAAGGAEGVSFYRWSTATPEEWQVAAEDAGNGAP